jgi:hypothetical protein
MSAAPIVVKTKKVSLEVASGHLAGQTFQFVKPTIKIGRGPENDIILDKDIKVSRFHLEIKQVNGTVSIHNLNDKNSAMVNGQLISTFPLLSPECFIRIGDTEIKCRVDDGGAFAGPPAPTLLRVAHGQPSARPNYGSPPRPSYQPPAQSKTGFYVVIGIVLLCGLYLFSSSGVKKKELELRSSEDVEMDIAKTQESIKKLKESIEKQGKDTIQYQTAQQHYVKGFRDYRQGQYGLAIMSLQAALTFNPQHELAQRYSVLARKKLDEMVRQEMNLGLKYKGQGNYRMCEAAYRKVLSLIIDEKDTAYQEALQYKRECELLQKDHQ